MNNSQSLGHLEIKVLEQIWTMGQGTAKSIHENLLTERTITLNTVQSTLERLYRKSLLCREKQSHSYVYQAIETKEVILGQLIQDMLNRFENDASLNIAAIINAAELSDDRALDKLEEAIRQKRHRRDC